MRIIKPVISMNLRFPDAGRSEPSICHNAANTPTHHCIILNVLFSATFILILHLSFVQRSCYADGSPASMPKNILLLGSYGYRMRPYQKFSPAFLSIMENNGVNRENLFFEYLDLKHVREIKSKQALVNMLQKKYSQINIVLIITVHRGALDFLLNEGKKILPKVPILAWIPTGPITAPVIFNTMKRGRRVIPVYARLDMKGTLERALDLFPSTKHVTFVSGVWNTVNRITQETREIFSQYNDKLEFEYTQDLSVEDMIQRMAHMPPQSIIIYYIVIMDKTGRIILSEDMLKKIVSVANAPVFCVYESLLFDGVVGGSVLSHKTEGDRIARIALTFLAGKTDAAEQKALKPARPVYLFDWQQIKKWKGNTSSLPEKTVFINRTFSLWELYGWYFTAVIVFTLFQSALIATLILQKKRKEWAEAATRLSEERFRFMVKLAPIPMGLITLNGAIRFINDQFSRIFGYTTVEIQSITDWWRYAYPDEDYRQKTIERWNMVVDKAVHKSNLIGPTDSRVTCSDGTVRVVEVYGLLLGEEVLVCFIDITARKQVEEDIRMLNRELEERVMDRTARLEAVNKELESFTYTVSHDLRAPLRHIQGFTGLLQKKAGGILDEQCLHYMTSISKAVKNMGHLIDDLLSFSRMKRNAMSFQPVELGQLVHDVIKELEPDTRGRDIDWQVGDLPLVSGDTSMLRIALGNLISNALKFTQTRKTGQIEIGELPGQTSEIVIFVRDNGVGFDMAYSDKLFSVFQRLHPSDEFEGTGIGLATVHQIIARHGGRIWGEGKVDQGAVFYFSLPQVDQGDDSFGLR